MRDLYWAIATTLKYRGYLPQPLTIAKVYRWLRQFGPDERKHIRALLENVIYLPEADVKRVLVEKNEALMERLTRDGLRPDQLVYVQVHDAGSSSPVMLNMLRDAANLERRRCKLLDANNTRGIAETTNNLGEGALIYVDDFIGSGYQLCTARDFAVRHVIGNFAEFALAPSICEEGLGFLESKGIEPVCGHIHSKVERPLHEESSLFDAETKLLLREICGKIAPAGLGFMDMAVMVVIYRNAPDNMPMLFRGSLNQKPYTGIFPRTTDMPIRS